MKLTGILLLSLLLNNGAFASDLQHDKQNIDGMTFEESKFEMINMIETQEQDILLEADLLADQTCVGELHRRLNQLKSRTAFAPFIGVAQTVGGFYIGAYTGALMGMAIQSTGWGALVYAMTGAVVGGGVVGGAALIGFGIHQGVVITRLIHINQMEKALLESLGKLEGSKYLDKLLTKYNRRNKYYPITKEQLSQFLVENNANGNLCNGKLVNPARRKSLKKLKQRIPLRSEFFAELNEAFH